MLRAYGGSEVIHTGHDGFQPFSLCQAACGPERWRNLATLLHALPSHRIKGATCRAGTIVAPRPEVWTSNVRDRLAVLPVVRSSIVTVIR